MKYAFFKDGSDAVNVPRIERILHMIILIFLALSVEIAMFNTESFVVFFLTRSKGDFKFNVTGTAKKFGRDNSITKKF